MGKEVLIQPQLPELVNIPPQDPNTALVRARKPRSSRPSRDPLDSIIFGRVTLPLQESVHQYLNKIQEEHGFTLQEIGADFLDTYFYPKPNGSFPTQKEIFSSSGRTSSNKRIKEQIKFEIDMVKRRVKNGPRSIESLGLPKGTYLILSREGVETVDEIVGADCRRLVFLSGNRPWFNALKEKMQHFFPGWNPEVVFRDELPPEVAFDF